MTCEMQAELKGQRTWPREEPVEKAPGSGNEVQSVDVKSLRKTQSAVWGDGPGEASGTPGAIAEAGAHGSRGGTSGVGRGEIKQGRDSGKTHGQYTGWSQRRGVATRVQLQWTRKPEANQDSTLSRSREQEEGRKEAEQDGPAKAAWRRSVCKRGGETAGGHG